MSGDRIRLHKPECRSVVTTKKLDLQLGEINLEQLFEQMQSQTKLRFVFNHEDVRGYTVNATMKGKTVSEILDAALQDKPLKYEILSDHIVISPKTLQQAQEKEMLRIKGVVTDSKGEALPGVTVILKGTTLGAATDIDGKYEITVNKEYATTLVFSFIGMKTQEIAINGRTEINVKMETDAAEMDEVVVTGIFNRPRESYTGSVKTVTTKELKAFRGQNVLSTLRNIDPSINISNDNLAGSNPNRDLEVTIRGNSSLPMSLDELESTSGKMLNAPLVIMDGFEVSLQKLNDFNDEEIESINILKDASATSIYGSRASMGRSLSRPKILSLEN